MQSIQGPPYADVECLLVVPDDEVHFSATGVAELSLHNLCQTPLAFFVSATSLDAFEASPPEGVLPPRTHVAVQLVLRSASYVPPHRIIVNCCPLPPRISAGETAALCDRLSYGQAPRQRQHLLRCAARAGGGTAQQPRKSGELAEARLAAAENLALRRSTALAHAEHRLARLLAQTEGGTLGAERGVLAARPTGEGPAPHAGPSIPLGSHVLVGVVGLAIGTGIGAVWADRLVGA